MPNIGLIGDGAARRNIWHKTGLDEAKRIWRTYPVSDYGKDWDEPEM